MALISVTRLRLRSPLYLPAFFGYAIPSTAQAKRAPGNLNTRTRRRAKNAFWTLTVWESETAMRAYMNSGSHRQAMPKLAQWCDEASVVHWQQDNMELPTWQEAEQRMVQAGRITQLPHPSAAQAAGTIEL